VLSNASTGFFRPMLRPDGQLLVYEFTGEGLTPSLIKPEVKTDLGTVEFLGTEYPIYRLLLIAISLGVVGALIVWYGQSRTGSRIRAMVSNPELAQAQGISVRWLAALTFVTGTCLAGLGGVMIAPLVPVQPFMGLDYVLRAFFVLIVGGLGSVAGLLSGATAIGGVDSVISAATNAANGYFAVLVLAILFLWLRPRGIVARG